MINLIADLHTHSVASGHAFGTVEEMGRIADAKGLKYLGIMDHGPALTGAPSEIYFKCSNLCPAKIGNTTIIFGCELNIIDNDGAIDLTDRVAESLDFALIGFHHYTQYIPSSEEGNTKTLIKAIKKHPAIDAVAHIGNPAFKVNYVEVIKCLNDYNVLIEINNRSFLPDERAARRGSKDNCLKVMDLCVKYNVRVIVSSDAHNQMQVGCFGYAREILENIGFPQDLILTADEQKLKEFLDKVHPYKRPKEILV
ncbi:MAG TPA: PHP domain-containing protein [bacterium]|nr:PHP domain-containing protein [bacterium]